MRNSLWKFPEQKFDIPADFAPAYHKKVRELLFARGITTNEELEKLILPKNDGELGRVVTRLHDPFRMKNMDKAVNRLIQAVNEKQKILVYGDYDVDGTTSVALVYSFLKDIDCNVTFYVPDRYAEGYGISITGIEKAIADNIQLIIALDCGIKDHKSIALAQENNIDVIVCDHHNEGEEIPNAFAVLDPKQHDCGYPFKQLSGCGVGYKFLYGYCIRQGIHIKKLNKYLDYVAISIASDIVPMQDENRVLMHLGLCKMQHQNEQKQRDKVLLSIQTMLEQSGLGDKNSLSVSNVVFKLAPRINAAGRIKSARDAVNLLISTDAEEAREWCDKIEKHNNERRNLDQNIARQALQMIQEDEFLRNSKSTVLFNESWHKGVVGIVASRVSDTYYRPTIILCGDGDIISGSARSVSDFDLYSAIEQCSEYLTAFGGHTFAAGLALKRENLEKFRQKFEEVVAKTIKAEQQEPVITIDAELSYDDISEKFLDEFSIMAPFGPENMNPVFVIKNVVDFATKKVGNDKTHVQFNLMTKTGNKLPRIIGFGMAEKWDELYAPDRSFDICFTMSEDEFNNTRRINLEAKDFRISQD